MQSERYFFEIAVYRVPEDAFNDAFNAAVQAHLDEMCRLGGVRRGQLRDWETGAHDRFWQAYGAPWQFNQVVAWLRLYRLGLQLRADLWSINAKRYTRRMAQKQLKLDGKAFELWVDEDETSPDIVAALRGELELFIRGWRGGRHVLDWEAFDNVSPFIDWRALMDAPAL